MEEGRGKERDAHREDGRESEKDLLMNKIAKKFNYNRIPILFPNLIISAWFLRIDSDSLAHSEQYGSPR